MGNERPSVSAVIDRIDTAGTGTALNELHEFLLQQAPSIAAGQSVGAAIAVPIPDSAPRWAHERPTFSGEAACEPGGGAGASGGPKASAKRFPRGHRRLYAALFIGAMLAILALGVLGGATITRLLTPTPPASALKQPLDAPVRATTSPDTAARSNELKESAALAITRPDPPPVALPNGVKNLPHLSPVPETKPTTIQGWKVREVSGGFASLVGPQGTWRVARGDIVPGLGRVESIVRWGNHWLVSTNHGLIASQ